MTPPTTVRRVAPSHELIEALRRHALKKKEKPVVLSSGEESTYYVDVKQAMLRPQPARIVGPMIASIAHKVGATTIGGMADGAIPVACAAIGCNEGNDLVAFFIRKERKEHGLQRLIEGPDEILESAATPCLIVDDVVTKGGSTVDAIRYARQEGLDVVGAISVIDRLAGGGEKIKGELGDVPYIPLTTIDDIYPERPDRA